MNKFRNYLIYFILFVPPLVFFTDLTRNPYYFQIVLLNAATVFLWIAWLYEGTKQGTLEIRKTPLDAPLWAFFAVSTISIIVVFFLNFQHPYMTYGIYSEGSKRWLFLLVNSIIVYYAAAQFADDNNRNKFILTAVWAGFLASVYGVMQYFGMEFIWPKVLNPFGGRSVSTFGNPNFLSSYLVLLIPVVFVLFWKAQEARKRNFYFICFVFMYSALLCTMTRSSWAGAFIAFAIVLYFLSKHEKAQFLLKKKALYLLVSIMLALFFLWPHSNIGGYNPSMVERLTEAKDATTSYYAPWHQRRLIWSCAWFMIKENPVIGKGWGCFELFYPSYQGRHLFLEAYHAFRTHANNTHDEILEIWSQTGTLGFGIYLWLLVVVFLYGLFLIKNLNGEKRLLAIALWASLIGMWTDNLLNVSLHFAVPGFLYWWNMGLLVSLGGSEKIYIDVKSGSKKLAAWLLIIFGALLIIRYERNFNAEMDYFQGFKLSKRNDPLAAIKYLEAAHSLQRLEVNNNYELANCYARTGQREKALWAYKESLRANAGYDEIYFNIATVLAQSGDYGNAMQEYTRSLYINPLSFEAYMALGSIFLQRPDIYAPAGIPLLSQCVRFFPNSRDVWNNLGYLYTKVGDNEDALNAYKKALEVDPDFEYAKKNVAVTLAAMGKKDDFLPRMEALMRRTEKDIVAKNWDDAVISGEALVKLVPRSIKANLYMANIYFTVGKLDQAVESYKALLQLDPSNVSGHANLGLAYYELKKFDLAKEELTDALQRDPSNKLLRQKLDETNQQLAGSGTQGSK